MNKKFICHRHCEARSAVAIQMTAQRRRAVKVNLLVFSLLGSLLLGCSVEGKNDYGSYYQKQASLDVLKMPPGITAEGADNYYVVPPGPMADVKTVSILPPGSRAYQSAMAKENAKAKPAAAPAPTPVVATTADANTATGTTKQ